MAMQGLLGRTNWRDREGIQGDADSRNIQFLSERVADLEERVDRLALLSMAMWTLLKKNTELDDEELMKQVTALDLQDGKLDGSVYAAVVECPACHRPVSKRHRKCLYCEHDLGGNGAFDGVVR